MSAVPEIFRTEVGTPYLRGVGVSLLARTVTDPEALRPFLAGFDEALGFGEYLDDDFSDMSDADALVKIAGQLCYMSFGAERTKNDEVAKYLDNIMKQGHGSVLEHPNFTFLCWGIDRSVTHELVRHRAGAAFSQVSQRYVDGKVLRFVERRSYQGSALLHARFEERIDRAVKDYDEIATHLTSLLSMRPDFAALSKRDKRKLVNQDARSCLPNETEAPIIMTLNGRSSRHVAQMRGSGPADVAIRLLLDKAVPILKEVGGEVFADFEPVALGDGTRAWTSKYPKV